MLITKIEAARRQIDAAIELYFHEGDELATHTLVGAAHISDHGHEQGRETGIHPRPIYRARLALEAREGDPSPAELHQARGYGREATLDFDPHNTELMLFIDIEMFKELTGSATDPMRAFHAYAAATFGREAFKRSSDAPPNE